MGCKSSKPESDIVTKIKQNIELRAIEALDHILGSNFKIPIVNESISSFPAIQEIRKALEDKEKQIEELRNTHASAMDSVQKKLNDLDTVTIKKVSNNIDNAPENSSPN